MNRNERLDLAQWVTEQALRNGANQVATSISFSRRIEIEYRDKKLEKLSEATRNSMNIDLYVDQRYSSQVTNDLKKDALQQFIREGISGTRYLAKDEYRLLPHPRYYPAKKDANLKIADSVYERLLTPDRVKFAAAIEAAAMAQSDQIISTTAAYTDVYSESVRVHSNGFSGERADTLFSISAEVTVDDKRGGRPEDYAYAAARWKGELPGAESIGIEAARRALRKIGQKKIETGKYDMIVENRAARRLVEILQEPMSASALQQKNSYLEGMLGKQVASAKLTMIDDPLMEKGLGSRLFDEEGLAAKKRILIDKGILNGYFVDNYYGRKLGMEPDSGSTSNLIFEPGTDSLPELIKQVKQGIVVNGFIGGNYNSTTGDFSFGVVGLLVKNGETIQPINEMNISGNAREFWRQLGGIGNDPFLYSSWQTPSMLFTDINFSGI
jgi:PmbA protein